MVRNTLNLGILCGALFVMYLPINEYFAHRAVTNELADLRLQLKDFDIADPNKAYFQAIETGKPLEFAWRIYLPKNCRLTQEMDFSNSGLNTRKEPKRGARSRSVEAPARISVFRLTIVRDNESLQINSAFGHSGQRTQFPAKGNGNSKLHENFDPAAIVVRQAAVGKSIEVNLDESIELIAIEKKGDNDDGSPSALLILRAALDLMNIQSN